MYFPEVCFKGHTPDGSLFLVRKYRPEDRDRVRWICSETGFLGSPQEPFYVGREEFADVWSAYWTDYEPESAFVAEVNGRVEGYLLGCVDTLRQNRIWKDEILPRATRRMLRPRWWRHPENRAFIRANLRSRLRGEFNVPMGVVVEKFPAHLHINIADPGLRGTGLGKKLMTAYFRYLKARGVKGVHLGTTSHNRQALPLYHRLGFQVLIKKRLTMYDHVIEDPPLFFLCMGKKL